MSQSSRSGEDGGGGVEETSAEWNARNTKKRARRFSSSERARHRVIEKERREAFNTCLLELAALLPALNDTKQSLLNKHIVVQESVKQHQLQRSTIEEAERKLLAATAEREELMRQLQQQHIDHQAQIASLVEQSTLQHSWDMPLPSKPVQSGYGGSQHNTLALQAPVDSNNYDNLPLTADQSFLFPDLPAGVPSAETVTAPVGMNGGSGHFEDVVDLDFYLRQAMQEYLPYSIPPA